MTIFEICLLALLTLMLLTLLTISAKLKNISGYFLNGKILESNNNNLYVECNATLSNESNHLLYKILWCLKYDEQKHFKDVLSRADEQLISYLKDGETVNAIKHYRNATGAGLKEAKDYIDLIKNSGAI